MSAIAVRVLRAGIAGVLLAALVAACGAYPLPDRLTVDDAAHPPAGAERVRGLADALVVPGPADEPAASDPRDHALYRASCSAYVAENGPMVRRFAVHVTDAASLPFARRAARFMATLWGCANQRLGTSCARLRRETVQVWLARSGDGGLQVGDSIYIYDVLAERPGIEWARELAHEFGHYLLPGASGFVEPEPWSNGLLGERLFLSWMRADIASGRLDAAQTGFVTRADLDDYCAKQVTPLVERMRDLGPQPELLTQRTARAMDAFTGLLMYADDLYGSSVLTGLLDYLPPDPTARARAADFLRALLHWVDAQAAFATAMPSAGGAMVYLPRGSFTVGRERGRAASLSVRGASVTPSRQGWLVRTAAPGWRMVSLTGSDGSATLRWQREASGASSR